MSLGTHTIGPRGKAPSARFVRPVLPPYSLAAGVLLFVAFGFGPNAWLVALTVVSFLIIVALVWRPGEPAVLLYLFVFQWLEASVWVFYASFHDLTIDDGSVSGSARQVATVLLLVGLVVQSVGARIAIGRWRAQDRELVESQLRRFPQLTWFRLYLVAVGVAVFAGYLGRRVPGLSQPFLALVCLRWAAFVVLTIATFFRRDASRTLWILVFLAEFFLAIGAYFSSFKFVFVLTFVAMAAVGVRFSARFKAIIGLVVVVAVASGVIWTAIKTDYRTFLSGGQRAQVVTVSYSESITKLVELISDLDEATVLDGFDQLLRRIEYVEYFSQVTVVVPDAIPHTRGERWLDAITRPIMPRLLFPNKATIDESYVTNRFVGTAVAGSEEGTQISIGYIGETYIDFGRVLMMPVLLGWGLVLGFVYRYLLQGAYSRGVLGMGEVSAIFTLTCSSIGNSLAKLVGGFAVSLLVVWLFNRFVVLRALPWLRR